VRGALVPQVARSGKVALKRESGVNTQLLEEIEDAESLDAEFFR